MATPGHHIAQFNIATMRHPLHHPSMQGFVDELAPVNALADRSPGFVWRLQDTTGDASAMRLYADQSILVNMSVWETIDALHAFTYRSGHIGVFRERAKWFERPREPHLVLWWVAAGTIPDAAEGMARLDALRRNGASATAFTFKQRFPPPNASDATGTRVLAQ